MWCLAPFSCLAFALNCAWNLELNPLCTVNRLSAAVPISPLPPSFFFGGGGGWFFRQRKSPLIWHNLLRFPTLVTEINRAIKAVIRSRCSCFRGSEELPLAPPICWTGPPCHCPSARSLFSCIKKSQTPLKAEVNMHLLRSRKSLELLITESYPDRCEIQSISMWSSRQWAGTNYG